ncbi:MAG TPA: hypothetical protein VN577_21045 [Terriglobales bacterium]|nr:hypothetical protein [Terriglobales bacterium]
MAQSFEESERSRLKALYAQMVDGELEDIAADSGELTDYGCEILYAEMSRRNLKLPKAPMPHSSEPEPPSASPSPVSRDFDGNYGVDYQKLVLVRRFRDLPAAMFAKGALQSAGIPCYLTDDNMVRMDWFISNALGGAKLLVRPEDMEASEDVLNQPIPESIDVEGDEVFEQPRCPKCGSLDVSYESINKPASYTSAWIGFPIPFSSNSWKCHDCGARWEEMGEDPVPSDS